MNSHLNWRYATKKFDPSRRIPKQDLDQLLEVLRISPSSFGLQPWKFVVVQDRGLREKLRSHAWNQSQITDADTLIVFCALKTMDEGHIRNYVDVISKVRGVPKESLLNYEQVMIGALAGKSPEAAAHWMGNQVYLALGVFLAECARRKIDACPMEGFDVQQFDEILELPQQGLQSVVLCAVGYRAMDDHHAVLKKVRFERNQVFIDKL
ncbi:MAG: NAD(P)H-dependent oxidoreductase [Candidatus Omnitrophica bacterium]|nr:NAD(P)H-dependent oxidoreductase [Candidatus Omnitrophota bacterium]MDE2222359.1 NAD(P)H-dependent oxidoreductase [Candidatus Omnitrophota bacterium]